MKKRYHTTDKYNQNGINVFCALKVESYRKLHGVFHHGYKQNISAEKILVT
jgi:hypothetical protein